MRAFLRAAIPALALALCLCQALPARAETDYKERMPNNWDGEHFHNTEPAAPRPERKFGLWRMFRWIFRDKAHLEPTAPVPVLKRSGKGFNPPPASGLRLTWLGHTCVLIEMDGLRLLTDPALSSRASPVFFAGPERYYPSPLPVKEIPPLDAVVISHNHYDHLDKSTIRSLAARTKLFLVPLGVARFLEEWGVPKNKIRELAWWEETKAGNLTAVCTPARHFSARWLDDRNTTLWCSWVLAGPEHVIFFGGDTGPTTHFEEIARRHGPFNATMLPIGAYNVRWPDNHLTPAQAVQAHQTLGGGVLLPTHWATFTLSDHYWTEPGELIIPEAEQAGVRLALPKPGESFEPDGKDELPYGRWWRESE